MSEIGVNKTPPVSQAPLTPSPKQAPTVLKCAWAHMSLTRGAEVLHVIPGCMPISDAAFYKYACQMNLKNWEKVPDSMRSEEIFDAMLASPWNAPGVTPARIPPLVLQLGPKEDCDNDARVKKAVIHSGYNLQFASARLRADPAMVMWAAATEEVKKITMDDAREICLFCEHVLNQAPPPHVKAIPHKEWRETCKQGLSARISGLSVVNSRCSIEGLLVPGWKAAAYFLVPYAMRDRLWPWREQHIRIHAELQGEGKMPAPPPWDNAQRGQPYPSARDNGRRGQARVNVVQAQPCSSGRENFLRALAPVLAETHPYVSDARKIACGIWSELSVDEQAQWSWCG
jgi:hypothetical protein